MKISLNWLKDYIDLNEDPKKLGEVLTQTGLEVEGLEEFNAVEGGLQGIVIGEVLTCEKHPNADKLSVTTVDIGAEEPSQIVCGAPNVRQGQKVLVATVGATLYPRGHEPFNIKKAKIRGEVSLGMICAEDELGLGESHDGIMVLDTDLANGTPAADYFNIKPDFIYEIGLTPNRADAASHLGTARDLKAFYGSELSWPDVSHFKVDNHITPITIKVENEEACPRYSGVMLSGLQVVSSPEWLQTRLKSIGLSPINAIVDITNFICHEMGQPLHAFDAGKIENHQILVKTLPAGTTFVTLDGKERKLFDTDLMICDPQKPMCIGGVFGGLNSGVTEQTTSVFLEGACFAPDYIRRTSMAHGLKTDASFRFERGTDPRITVYAVKRAAMLIKEICGGEISSEIFDHYPSPVQDLRILTKYAHIDRLIGKKLEKDRIKDILTSLDIGIEDEESDHFYAIVPPYRVDVTREADVIEEVLRIYGFNNVEIPLHYGADYLSDFPVVDRDQVQFQTSDMLSALGFNEIMTNSLTKQSYAESVDFIDSEKSVQILNQLSEDLGVLRQDMLFTGLESIAYNINRRQKNLKFFEFGKTYERTDDGFDEHSKLILLMSGDAEGENWINKARRLEFHDLSSVVSKILNKFNIIKSTSIPIHDNRISTGLKISKNQKEIVAFGRVSNKVLRQLGIDQEVWYAEFNWNHLLKQSAGQINYQEISKFPEVRRDLSLVLDKQITFEQIRDIAEKNERKLLREVNVFDVYEGKSIGDDKKAYALKFILQDQHKTLNDKVIDKTMQRLMKSFETELGAIIRK